MKMLENTPTYGQLASLSSFQYIWCLNFFDKNSFDYNWVKSRLKFFQNPFFSTDWIP